MSAQTWITIVTAIISTGTAIFLAIITWRYVRLTNEILKATNKPEVILFLYDNGGGIYLNVQNIGAGYASDIKFKGNLSFKPTHPGNQPLKETEPFKSGINYLGPEYKIDVYMCGQNEIKELPKDSFEIIVTYKDSTDITYQKRFPFDVSSLEKAWQLVTPQKEP